jgi:hypothetical protein
MGLQAIREMAPPPKNPIHAGTATSWLEVQHHFRCVLPACLDEFGRTYGSGFFQSAHPTAGMLSIFNPHDPAYGSNVECECEVYLDLRKHSPQWYPHPCFPEKNGLLPLGYVHGSGVLPFYLLLTDDPKNYAMVFDDGTTGHVEYPSQTFFDFFEDVLCNRIKENCYVFEDVHFFPQKLVSYRNGS